MDTKEFEIKDSINVEGITADHVWYNATRLTQKMSFWELDFKKLVQTMEDRHNEHLKIIRDLLDERGSLRRELANLKAKE
jgi:hypothetical protein